MKRVLITGGCGFIGTNLVIQLLQDINMELVVSIDMEERQALTDKLITDIRYKHIRSKIQRGNELLISNIINNHNVDTVIHLAANSDISASAKNPQLDFYGSTEITNVVLEAMRLSRAGTIIYTSGSGVYGDNGGEPVVETMAQLPVSPYGASKASCEALISAYVKMYGIRGIVLRMANVVGLYATHGVCLSFCQKLIESRGEQLQILGDGNQTKSYIFVGDVISAMVHLSQIAEERTYSVWNCASEDTISVDRIAQIAISGYRKLGSLTKDTKITKTGGRGGWPGDVPVIKFNIDKLKKTGWSPTMNSEAAVSMCINSIYQNAKT